MKANKGLILGIAAGVAVAGVATYFLATKNGKKSGKKLKAKGQKVADQFKHIMDSMSCSCEAQNKPEKLAPINN